MRLSIVLISILIVHLCWVHQAGANGRGNGGGHSRDRARSGRGRSHRRQSGVTTTSVPTAESGLVDEDTDGDSSDTSTRQHRTRHSNRRHNRRRYSESDNQDLDDGSDGHHQIGHTEVEYDVDVENNVGNLDQFVQEQFTDDDFTDEEYNRNCTTCVERETQKAMRIEMIKEQILRKLAMDTPPNITDPGQIPDVPVLRRLLDEYDTDFQSDRPHSRPNSDDGTIHQTIEFATPPPEDLGIPETWNTVYFGLDDIETTSLVEEAELYFFVEPSMPVSSFSVSIQLQRLLPPIRSGEDPLVRTRYIKATLDNEGMGAWFHMDVKNLVQTWVRNPTSNYGLMIVAQDMDGDNLIVRMPEEGDRSHKPFINLKYKKRNSNRSRREVKGYDCRPLSKMTFCCRYRLEVNFESFGWNFIIQPQRYNMNYCSGDCPAYFLPKHPQTNMLTVAGTSQDGTPCCHPTSLTGIDMLYYSGEGNKIIVGHIAGMIIQECGCA